MYLQRQKSKICKSSDEVCARISNLIWKLQVVERKSDVYIPESRKAACVTNLQQVINGLNEAKSNASKIPSLCSAIVLREDDDERS